MRVGIPAPLVFAARLVDGALRQKYESHTLLFTPGFSPVIEGREEIREPF